MYCDCAEVESLEHVFLRCSAYEKERGKLEKDAAILMHMREEERMVCMLGGCMHTNEEEDQVMMLGRARPERRGRRSSFSKQ